MTSETTGALPLPSARVRVDAPALVNGSDRGSDPIATVTVELRYTDTSRVERDEDGPSYGSYDDYGEAYLYADGRIEFDPDAEPSDWNHERCVAAFIALAKSNGDPLYGEIRTALWMSGHREPMSRCETCCKTYVTAEPEFGCEHVRAPKNWPGELIPHDCCRVCGDSFLGEHDQTQCFVCYLAEYEASDDGEAAGS